MQLYIYDANSYVKNVLDLYFQNASILLRDLRPQADDWVGVERRSGK